jgi:hypothetical protein
MRAGDKGRAPRQISLNMRLNEQYRCIGSPMHEVGNGLVVAVGGKYE